MNNKYEILYFCLYTNQTKSCFGTTCPNKVHRGDKVSRWIGYSDTYNESVIISLSLTLNYTYLNFFFRWKLTCCSLNIPIMINTLGMRWEVTWRTSRWSRTPPSTVSSSSWPTPAGPAPPSQSWAPLQSPGRGGGCAPCAPARRWGRGRRGAGVAACRRPSPPGGCSYTRTARGGGGRSSWQKSATVQRKAHLYSHKTILSIKNNNKTVCMYVYTVYGIHESNESYVWGRPLTGQSEGSPG